jgi:pimeloyl-ACP methyl ester carboxylesterase
MKAWTMLLAVVLSVWVLSSDARAQTVEPIEFDLERDSTVQAEEWTITVPENRSNPDSRDIPIRFVRFESRAESPGPPIIYLAGGPGGAGTGAAAGRRWDLFDRLRDVSDVIALDQRGTGRSDEVPGCESDHGMPPDSASTRARVVRVHRQALDQCLAFWESQGVDLQGYTTWESAADINAVREALGVDRVHLLGISFGTHLALATLKRYPETVDRLVLASAEGLDQTVKRPARHDRFLSRLQAAIDADSAAAARYPDVDGRMREVLDAIEADPPIFTVNTRDGASFERTLGRFEAQLMTGFMMGDPKNATLMLQIYHRASEGDFSGFGRLIQWFATPTVQMSGMAEAMDLASGISAERLALVRDEAETAVVGDALNFPMPHLQGAIPGIDLGEAFRAPVMSNRPALLISGTLDGRTFPEAHAEIAEGFPNGAILTVENAGHNLFFSHRAIGTRIADFFAGTPARADTLVAPAPSFMME